MGWIVDVLVELYTLAVEFGGLVLVGITAAMALQLVWPLLGFLLPQMLQPALRFLGRRTHGVLGPPTQTLLCVLTSVIVGLILRKPGEGPWASIMTEDHQEALSTEMLAGAAALFVLLNFAASQARSAEADARESEKYLGQAVATYRFLRSPWTLMTRQRAFQVLVIALFAVPFLLTMVPAPEPVSPLGGASTLADLLTASWCASFALVATTLILNLVSSLRISLLETIRPNSLHQRIWWDLRDESGAEWRDLLRSSTKSDPPPRRLHEWCQHHIATTLELPAAEREGYLLATVRQLDVHVASEELLERAERLLERAELADAALVRADVEPADSGAWRRILTWWRVERRRERAQRMLETHEEAHRALVDAFTEALTAASLDDSFGDELTSFAHCATRGVILSGEQMDHAHQRLVEIDEPALAQAFLTPSSSLHDRSARLMLRDSGAQRSPLVLTLTATAFRDLARAAFDPWGRDDLPVATGYSLSDLVEDALQIEHRQTREFALSALVTHFIRGVVIKGLPIEAPGALTVIWKQARHDADRLDRSTAARGHHLMTLVESRAFDELTHHSEISPTATGHLLTVLTGWRGPCALLHKLLYARRSHRELTAKQLAPYAEAISHITPFTFEALEELRTEATKVIRDPNYNTSHFTSDDGVVWLIRALGEQLTPGLCLGFERQRDSFQILELRLLDFIQWHVIAGSGYGAPSAAADAVEIPTSVKQGSTAALWGFCRRWEEVRPRDARDLRVWLRYAVGPEPHIEPSARYTWALRTRLAGSGEW